MKIIFVCHGNICRSPIAEYLFLDMINKEGLTDKFIVSSRATSQEEISNDIYPPAKRTLMEHHIPFKRHYATQISREEFISSDYIIIMDESNRRYLKYLFPNDDFSHVYKLMSFANKTKDVSDPWYSGDFASCYDDIKEGLEGLLNFLKSRL